MKKKQRRNLLRVSLAYLLLWSCGTYTWGAASGNYSDLLPIGAASDTTVISRGSGWAVTTLPTSQTFGDSLSRLSYTAYQSTAAASINATTTVSTITALSQGNVGNTTFPASWVATGRSIRIKWSGLYSTTNSGPNWTWAVNLGTTPVLTTGPVASPGGNTNAFYTAEANMTIAATGASGTVNGTYAIFATSGATTVVNLISFSTTTNAAVAVDLTSQLTVNPTFTWGTANSSITVRNLTVEFLN